MIFSVLANSKCGLLLIAHFQISCLRVQFYRATKRKLYAPFNNFSIIKITYEVWRQAQISLSKNFIWKIVDGFIAREQFNFISTLYFFPMRVIKKSVTTFFFTRGPCTCRTLRVRINYIFSTLDMNWNIRMCYRTRVNGDIIDWITKNIYVCVKFMTTSTKVTTFNVVGSFFGNL